MDTSANNFHALRLVFATLVALYHLVMLSDVADWRWLQPMGGRAAEIGIQGFFVVSGYLVSASLDRSSSLGVYFEKRARRLYPAYAVVIIGSTLLALALVEETRRNPEGWLAYLGANLVFLNFLAPELPGVFTGNPAAAVNGALWTLKVEVMFYLLLPLLMAGLVRAGRLRWLVLVLIYAGAEAWRIGLRQEYQAGQPVLSDLAQQLPGQLSFFIVGVGLYLWRDRLVWRAWMPALALAGLVLSLVMAHVFEPLRALGLGVLVIWAAIKAPAIAAVRGDISYGLYILHFPIIQTVVALGLMETSPWIGAGLALGVTLLGAVALWVLVERPALRRDSAYRAA